MSEQKYELAFYGKLVEGSSLQGTKEQVALLFKTNVEQIEKMFTGSRVVIRNKLDQDTAMKYIVALKKRGALCQIELMGEPGVAVNFDNPSMSTAPAPAPAPVESRTESPPKAEEKKISAKAAMSENGLPIVGEKVDEILSTAHMNLAPVGVRLGEEKEEIVVELHALDNVSIAPPGSVLVDHKEKPPVSVPDISHIQLAPKD